MDINDLFGPLRLSQDVKRTGREFLNAPADFGPANRSFAGLVANPMLFQTGGGNVADPMQTNQMAGTSYLGERAGIASTNLAEKASFADLMSRAGSNIGALTAAMNQLRTQQQSGSTAWGYPTQFSLQNVMGGSP